MKMFLDNDTALVVANKTMSVSVDYPPEVILLIALFWLVVLVCCLVGA